MSENDPYGSEGGARNDRPYPIGCEVNKSRRDERSANILSSLRD
jgi:hypothetical protein